MKKQPSILIAFIALIGIVVFGALMVGIMALLLQWALGLFGVMLTFMQSVVIVVVIDIVIAIFKPCKKD